MLTKSIPTLTLPKVKIALSILIVSLGLFSSACSTTQAQPPNILFILSDDQRYDTMGAMPILSQFMEQGTTFSNAYTTTPLCCPSRASILTGEYAHNHGVLGNRKPYGFSAFEDESTLATWLHDAGYRTALIGKYLNDYNEEDAPDAPPGWDRFLAFIEKPGYDSFQLSSHKDGAFLGVETFTKTDGVYSTDYLTEEAVTFLKESGENPEQPFFLFFTPFAPHDPATPPERYREDDSTFDVKLPSYNESDVSDKSSFVSSLPTLSEQETRSVTRVQRNSHGSLAALDEDIGMLLEELKSSGALKNTVVIYLSDNGVHWGEHRITHDKATPYEETIHVPLLLYDGRAPLHGIDDRLVLNIDLAPSIMQLAGQAVPLVDGRSIFEESTWRSSFLTEGFGGTDVTSFSSVHSKDAVYILFENGEEELYNLAEDPYELTNLAEDPSSQSLKESLAESIDQLKTCYEKTCH